MPEIGKPRSADAARFQNVQIAKNRVPTSEGDAKERERLLNKLTGYREKNDLYVDGKKHNKMGKDEFLKLLTHQLQNQDPLKPMEQNKMAAELAQFSQLEQLSNLNTKFDNFNSDATAKGKFYGASFLGKEVVTNGSTLNFEGDGTKADVLFSMPKPATKVLVRIFDKNNNMVSEMWKENIGRGNQTVSWDGVGLDGTEQSKGDYRVNIRAWDQFSDPIDVKTKVKGLVESVFFENGETILKVDGKKVFLRDVDSFHTNGKSQNVAFKDDSNNISSALQGVEVKDAVKNLGAKLPIAQDAQSNLNLKKMKPQKPVPRKISTGLTNVYDVE
jgi:flagellar basal-body rod modification protein FlgD